MILGDPFISLFDRLKMKAGGLVMQKAASKPNEKLRIVILRLPRLFGQIIYNIRNICSLLQDVYVYK